MSCPYASPPRTSTSWSPVSPRYSPSSPSHSPDSPVYDPTIDYSAAAASAATFIPAKTVGGEDCKVCLRKGALCGHHNKSKASPPILTAAAPTNIPAPTASSSAFTLTSLGKRRRPLDIEREAQAVRDNLASVLSEYDGEIQAHAVTRANLVAVIEENRRLRDKIWRACESLEM